MTRLKTFVMIFVFLLAANCSLWADTTPEEEQVITLTRQCVDNLKELAEQCYEENDYWLAEESYALITSIAQNKDETVKRIEDGRYELYNNIPNYLPQKSIDDYNQAENCHKAGLKLLKDGKYQAASESLKNALSFYSFFPEVLVELGGCHEKLKNPQQAIQNYRLAVKYFRLQSHRSKEQNKLLDDALKAIDRLDALGKQFLKCQNDYTSNLINHAKKCLTKGYDGVASQALVQTMKVDAAHPKAQELLAVIEQ
ncbi:MAG TPA: hypothetical protein VJC37_05920, partial [Planctomycetota bacterium]|nr:hypothetical protein [Planctomycetota bacterium]